MSQDDTKATVRALERRVAELESRQAGRMPAYGRFYAAVAGLSIALVFMPIFDDVVVDESYTRSFGTLWDMASTDAGGPAVFGILLVATLVIMLVVATFRVRGPGLPSAIAVVAGLIILMLITKPSTGTPTPDLSPAAAGGLALYLCTAALAVIHAVHVARRNKDERLGR